MGIFYMRGSGGFIGYIGLGSDPRAQGPHRSIDSTIVPVSVFAVAPYSPPSPLSPLYHHRLHFVSVSLCSLVRLAG